MYLAGLRALPQWEGSVNAPDSSGSEEQLDRGSPGLSTHGRQAEVGATEQGREAHRQGAGHVGASPPISCSPDQAWKWQGAARRPGQEEEEVQKLGQQDIRGLCADLSPLTAVLWLHRPLRFLL